MQQAYEYRHIVSFAETNLVGNVYYAHHVLWQGRVREMFLREHAPDVLAELGRGLAIATVRCACEYFAELRAFDEVCIRMRLGEQIQNRLTLHFEYWRRNAGGEELVAKGEQQVAFLRRTGDATEPTPIPASLRAALKPFGGA